MFHLEGGYEERDSLYRKTFNFLNSSLDSLGSETVKISNIDEYNSFINKYPEFIVHPSGYEWPPGSYGWKFGEIGIWASTFLALKKFIQTDYEYLMMLEDDICVADTFMEHLQTCMEQIKNNFDVFMFFNPENTAGPEVKFDPSDINIATQKGSTACYVVTRSAAEKAIKYVTKSGISDPVDWHFLNFHYPDFIDQYYKVLSITKDGKQSCWLALERSTIQNQTRDILF